MQYALCSSSKCAMNNGVYSSTKLLLSFSDCKQWSPEVRFSALVSRWPGAAAWLCWQPAPLILMQCQGAAARAPENGVSRRALAWRSSPKLLQSLWKYKQRENKEEEKEKENPQELRLGEHLWVNLKQRKLGHLGSCFEFLVSAKHLAPSRFCGQTLGKHASPWASLWPLNSAKCDESRSGYKRQIKGSSLSTCVQKNTIQP